jgi:hypothetical protein
MKRLTIYTSSKVLLMLSLVLVLGSCKDFLEVTPKDQATDGTVWATSGNADLFLNNVYSSVYSPYRNEDPEENRTDNSFGKPNSNTRNIYRQSSYTPATSLNAGGMSGQYWTPMYTNIRKANLFIEKVTASTLPDSYKKLRLAEARFLRAYFYHLLWTHYAGVPIITDVLNITEDGDAVFKARNTDAETYKFIVDELTAAAADLPNTQGKGRATKGAALALKGFCELFNASPLKNTTNDKARWALAAATNKQIIDLKTYSLYPDYEKLFFEEAENSNETIFARQHVGGITGLGNSKAGFWGPNMVNGLEASWCGVAPTHDMVNVYQMANGKDITDPTSGYDPQNPYANREERFYQSIVYDGIQWLGFEMIIRRGLKSANEIDLASSGDHTNTGYYLRKGIEPKYAVAGNNNLSGADFQIFRYAEILLSYAEAQNEAVGPDNSVYDAVNQVRARAKLPALPAGLTQAEMREEIAEERRIELFFEEKRWYDLIRLKLAETIMNGHSKGMRIDLVNGKWVYTEFPAAQGEMKFFPAKNYLFPIPQAAIDRNSKLTQNPGY